MLSCDACCLVIDAVEGHFHEEHCAHFTQGHYDEMHVASSIYTVKLCL